MGNQGMTNWKFSAFFAIVLMLVAGMVSTAIAADGDGKIVVTAPAADAQPLEAGEVLATPITLTYTAFNDLNDDGTVDAGEAAINMNGGAVKIMIPSGWKVPFASLGVTDGTTALFFHDAAKANAADGVASGAAPAGPVLEDGSQDSLKRITVTKDGDNITMIEVQLHASEWGSNRDAAAAARALTFTFGSVTVAIPNSLAYTDGRNSTPYHSYTFTTQSKSKGGVFTRLKPTAARPVTQPRIQVGSIGAAASGEATVEPATAYAGDKYTFMIKFKALGPLYDDTSTGGDNNNIIITPVAGALGTDQELSGAPPSNSNVSISRTRGNVRFGSPRYTVDESTRAITVNITRMDKDAEVHVSYGPVTIPAALAADDDSPDASIFTVAAGTGAAGTALTKAVGGGRTQAKAGSGKLTISPDVIEAGSTRRTFTITYEALTDVDGILAISLPTYDVDGAATSIFRYDDPNTQAIEMVDIGPDQVSTPDTTEATETVATTTGVTLITWDSLSLKKGNKFRTVIKSADVPLAAFGKRDITATMATETMTMVPSLYVVETEPGSVSFTAMTSAEPTAGSKQTVTFTFMADKTPIAKKGSVRVQLPSGWTGATTGDADGKVTVSIVDDGADDVFDGDPSDDVVTAIDKKYVSAGRRTIRVTLTDHTVEVGQQLRIKYGDGKQATLQSTAGTVQIPGFFRASSGSQERSAGTVQLDIVNAANGSGTATISPTSVRAGSTTNRMTVVYTASGTMDGGSVTLEVPSTWGAMQRDPLKRNYINVTVSGGTLSSVDYGSTIVVANLTTLRPNGRVTFTYGGGTGSSANRGAEAQVTTGAANFMIKSDGNGDGMSALVMGTRKKEAVKDANPDALGETFTDAIGVLKVMVGGADDGTGTAMVRIVDTKAGAQDYVDPTDSTKTVNEMRVHAGDNATYLEFTYKPGQTIEEGQLQFTVPGGWSDPQGDDPLIAGYTRVAGGEPAVFSGNSLTVDIIRLDQDASIVIHYGEYFGDQTEGGAKAPGVAMAASRFAFAVRGTATGSLTPLRDHRDTKLDVKIWKQASGGGSAMIEATDDMGALGAGDMGRELTITYTADGQFDGKVKVTTPEKWTSSTMDPDSTTGGYLPLMADDFEITSTGSIGTAMHGNYYTHKEMTLPEGLAAREVIVDSVMLDAGETVTFVYKGVMVQPTAATGVAFGVASMGSDGPGTGFIALTAPTVDVGEASAGSGTAMVDPMFVTAATAENDLTITYTVAGEASYPKDIRVAVPTGWSEPTNEAAADANKGTYKVELMRDGKLVANVIEKIAPIDGSMVARVLPGGVKVMGGDMVVFTYQNADAPAAPARSMFRVSFDGTEIDSSPTVIVTSAAGPAMLAVEAPSELSVDTGDAAMLTIKLQDADGNAAAMAADTAVTLASSSSQGMFSMTDGGAAITMVTISGGHDEAMVYYKDTMIGTSTITASASGLTSGTASIMVTTETTEITAVSFAPSVAMPGTEVTVNAEATPGRTATFSVGTIVTDMGMTESPSGTYSGSFTVVVDQHPDGMYPVSVTAAGQSMTATGQLTIDDADPSVTDVAVSAATVANGDTVTITATVTDAGSGVDSDSVMANVAMLDSTQTDVAMTMGADGYSAPITISADNEAMNGEHTITVTAMDNAGNSGTAIATVTLKNELTFTSTLPQGISLFSVPLDVDGLNTVGDLAAMLENESLLITYDGTTWNSRSDAVPITGSLGILVSMSAEEEVIFTGDAWADTTVSLAAGSNLIGLPVNDASVTNISDIAGQFATGVVTNVIASSGGEFQLVAAAGDPADGPVAGDAAYLVMASSAGTATLTGPGWMTDDATAAPIALSGYTVGTQTPALNVHGSVVDEITGLAKQGFRVKVKNLSTKSALSHITDEAADGYDMTFVDLADSYAARVGDVLEITADSPDPLVGVQPVRHIVTVDDVKNSRITLEDLIAYEIPAETELLRNYPNPFNPETWIPYHLSEDADVSLTIYDVNGALVRDIDVGHQTAAKYDTRSKAIYWDGRNQFGEQVASGIYFYSLNAGDFSATRKMVILK